MKFYEKYLQLKQKSFLSKILVETVYSKMVLEEQYVSKTKVVKIVTTILKERELKNSAFFKKLYFLFHFLKNHCRITTTKSRSRFQKILNIMLFICFNNIDRLGHAHLVKTF